MTFYGSERIQQLLTYLKNYLTEKFAAKQDKLTFDATPTENSMNPVRSGGVYDALSEINIDTVEDIIAPQFDPAATYYKGTSVIYNNELYSCSVQSHTGEWDSSHFSKYIVSNAIKDTVKNYTVNSIIADITGTLGCRNMLNINLENETYVKGGITYTINKNRYGVCTSIRIQGNSSATGYNQNDSILQLGSLELPPDEVQYSGAYISGSLCPFGTTDDNIPNGIWLYLQKGSRYDGTGSDFDYKRLKISSGGSVGLLKTDEDYGTYYSCLWVQAGSGSIDVTVYPMVGGRNALEAAPYFRPYAPTNRDLPRIIATLDESIRNHNWIVLDSISSNQSFNISDIISIHMVEQYYDGTVKEILKTENFSKSNFKWFFGGADGSCDAVTFKFNHVEFTLTKDSQDFNKYNINVTKCDSNYRVEIFTAKKLFNFNR